jgi:hypothetical protein
MGFFSARGRTRPRTSAEIGVHRKGRELVSHDVARRERPRNNNAADHANSLMQGVTETSLDEIDELIAELQRRREKLLSESARLQREMADYTKFSQSAVQSTKISTKHLAHFKTQRLSHLKKVPDAPAISAPHVECISNEEHHESGTGAPAQHNDQCGDQAEATAAASLGDLAPDHEG